MMSGSIGLGEPSFGVGEGVVPSWVGVGDAEVEGEDDEEGDEEGEGEGENAQTLVSMSWRCWVTVCCGVAVLTYV